MDRRKFLSMATSLGAVAGSVPMPAQSQGAKTDASDGWPTRPIRYVVPYPVGGSADLIGRLIAREMQKSLGVPVVVENIQGASGTIGSNAVRRSPPDGYSVVHGASSSHSIAVIAVKSLAYDPLADFAPVVLVLTSPNAIYVRPGLGVRNLDELLSLVRKKANVSYGHAGVGSSSFLSGALFEMYSKAKMTRVAYPGTAPLMQDVMAGHVDIGFGDLGAASPHIRSGQLVAVAVTGPRRSSAHPDIPTVSEAAFEGFESVLWHAIFAPAATPPHIVERLNAAVNKALQEPSVKGQIERTGAEPGGGTPADLEKFVRADIVKWKNLVKEANISFD